MYIRGLGFSPSFRSTGPGEVARDVHALVGDLPQQVMRRRGAAMERRRGDRGGESQEQEERRQDALPLPPDAAAQGEQYREGQYERSGEGGGGVSPLEVEGKPARQQTRDVADSQQMQGVHVLSM